MIAKPFACESAHDIAHRINLIRIATHTHVIPQYKKQQNNSRKIIEKTYFIIDIKKHKA